MMHTSLLLALSLASPAQDAVQLRWAPVAGAVVEHSWITGHQLFLDSFTRAVDGEREKGTARWAITSERSLRAVDEMLRVGDGRPLALRRQYEAAEQKARLDNLADATSTPVDVVLGTGLVGTSVVWTWVPQEGTFGRYYDALEAQEDLLEDLREDLELRTLLPAGPVSVGATWLVDPGDLRDVLDPGGDLTLDAEKGNKVLKRSLASGIGGSLHQIFAGQSAGLVSAKLVRVEEGLAHVALRFDRVRYLVDMTSYVTSNALYREHSLGLRPSGGRLVIDFTGDGALVWDLRNHRAVSFVMNAAEEVEMTIDSIAGESKVEERMKMVGTFKAVYEAKAPQ